MDGKYQREQQHFIFLSVSINILIDCCWCLTYIDLYLLFIFTVKKVGNNKSVNAWIKSGTEWNIV